MTDALSRSIPTMPATRPKSTSAAGSVAPCRKAHRSDEAVDHAAGSDASSPTPPVDFGCGIKVGGGIKAEKCEPPEEAPELGLALVSAGTCDKLHDDRLGYGHRSGDFNQFFEPPVHPATGSAVVFNPR